MYIVATFIAIALLSSLLFFAAKKKIQRRAACFALYEVRDNLVCLVAEGKLDEDSRAFRHYYARANAFLSAVPKVGLDDALESLISLRKNGDLEKSLAKSRRELEEIQKLKEMQSEEVRLVVASFYKALFQMMIAHSSLSRFLYLQLMHESFIPFLDRVSPDFSRQIRVAKFAVDESNALAPA
jgi:hypothetical protein